LSIKGKKSRGKVVAASSADDATEGADGKTIHVSLDFKRYIYDPKKQMHQR